MSAQSEPKIIKAVFPRLNKQATLACVRKEIARESYIHRIRIEQTFIVGVAEWHDLTENLLDRRDIWAGRGGVESSYEGSAELAGVDLWKWPEDERRRWLSASNLIGIEVVNAETRERFVVDPEGYDYARYVGVPQ